MSNLAIHFLNDEDEPVTQEAVDHFAQAGELYPALKWEEAE